MVNVNINGNADLASPPIVGFYVDIYGINVQYCTNVIIEKGTFNKIAKAAVYATNCNNLRISSNDIIETYNLGLNIWNCENVHVEGNKLSGWNASFPEYSSPSSDDIPGSVGILFSSSDKVVCKGNLIENFKNTAAKSEGGSYIRFEGNTARNFGKDGIKIQGLPGNTVKYAVITNNVTEFMHNWDAAGYTHYQVWDVEEFSITNNIAKGGVKGSGGTTEEDGIQVYASEAGFITKKSVVSGNVLTDMGTHGIYAWNIDNVIFDNNIITDFASENLNGKGIFCETGCTNIIISENIIKLTTRPASGFSSGIDIVGVNNKIINNKITNIKDIGIKNNITAGEYQTISGNFLSNIGASSIYVAGSGTLKSLTISDNQITSAAYFQIYFVTTGHTINNLLMVGNTAHGNFNNDWLYLTGTGDITKMTLGTNAAGGNSYQSVNYGMTPGIVQIDGVYRTTATPEGLIVAPVGSTALNVNGGVGTTFYVKETGTGNTGWAAK